MVVEHDGERSVLLVLSVSVDERLLDEAMEAPRRALPASGPDSWSACWSHELGVAIEAPATSAGPAPRQLYRIAHHAERRMRAPDSLAAAEDQYAAPVEEGDSRSREARGVAGSEVA